MYVERSDQDFVETLVSRLGRLDLDALVFDQDDDRLALEEAAELCRSVLASWSADAGSTRTIVGKSNWGSNNPIVVLRRILSEAQVVEQDSTDDPPFDRVFISHAGSERRLAECLDEEIRKRLPKTDTFVASRPGDIPDGEWFDTVRQKLREADAYICIVTPTSKDRHWVIWEHGAAWMSKKLLVTTRAGIANSDLPELFKYRQTRSLEDPEEAALVFTALGDTGEDDLEAFCSEIAAITEATTGPSTAPSPIEVNWGGGNSSWTNLTRKLEVDLVGDGPVEITDIRAWMTHRDDPSTPHMGTHSQKLPTKLGGSKTQLDETVKFWPDKLPDEQREAQNKPQNVITLSAEVEFIDKDGNVGKERANDLVVS